MADLNSRPAVLCTGMGGVLGEGLSHLAPAKGSRWIVAGRKPPQAWSEFPFQLCDLSHPKEISSMMVEIRPRVLLHAAAMSKVDACESQPDLARQINVESVAEALAVAKKIDAKVVFISTDQVFDGQKLGYTEDTPVSPLHEYGRTKVMAEALVLAAGGTVIRIPLLLGPQISPNRRGADAWLVGAARRQESLGLFTDEFRAVAAARLLAGPIHGLVERPLPGIFHLAGATAVSRWQLGVEACAAAQVNMIHYQRSLENWQGPAKPPHLHLLCQRAEKEIGFQPPDLRQSLTVLYGPPYV